MRLYPPVTQDEAQTWLSAQASASFGPESLGGLAKDIETMAEAMALISAIELPEELEPLFP